MSNTARWILAIILVLFGIGAAAFAVFGGAFSTVACVNVPPDWVYYVLIFAGVITLAGAVVPAVLLVRKAKGIYIVVSLGAGFVLSCLAYSGYLALLGQNC
jgi:hypothetical protein